MQIHNGALAGRVAVVVGASSGIGFATATQLAEEGAQVHGIARRSVEGPLRMHAVDATQARAVAHTIDGIGQDAGIDILVLAIGYQTPDRRLEQLDAAGWDALITTNLDATFYCLRPALPYLRSSRGTVVALGSVSGVWPDLSGPAYQAAKLGLLAFIRAAAIEELPHGVRFSVVHPGMTDTAMLSRRPEPVPDEIREHALKPEDVARVCVFAASQPPGVVIPEVTVLPSVMQVPGRTAAVALERQAAVDHVCGRADQAEER